MRGEGEEKWLWKKKKEISGKSATWGMWDFSPPCWTEALQLQRTKIIKFLLPTSPSRSEQHRMLRWAAAVCPPHLPATLLQFRAGFNHSRGAGGRLGEPEGLGTEPLLSQDIQLLFPPAELQLWDTRLTL